MAWTYTGRTTITWTDVARPATGKEGRFGFGVFGTATFGTIDAWTRIARPINNTGAVAGVAIAGIAVAGRTTQGWYLIARPQ